jgi:hypothetical protein
MTNSAEFAVLMAESFRDVRYNEAKRSGTATVPNVGTIEFREAGSDPAVIVNLVLPKRFKGSAETAAAFIEVLRQAWSNSD